MHFTKIFIIFIGLSLAIGFFGCTKGGKVEAPQQEQITKDLVPAKAEVKSQNFPFNFQPLTSKRGGMLKKKLPYLTC